jgi:hypothetical protein
MSNRSKGNRIIREKAVPHYEEQGFIVDRAEQTGRYVKEKDLFSGGLDGDYNDTGFDLVAIRSDKIILIQVTTNKPKVQKWYKDFAEKFANDVVEVHVYTWYDRKGPRIQNYQKDRTIKEQDLRK